VQNSGDICRFYHCKNFLAQVSKDSGDAGTQSEIIEVRSQKSEVRKSKTSEPVVYRNREDNTSVFTDLLVVSDL